MCPDRDDLPSLKFQLHSTFELTSDMFVFGQNFGFFLCERPISPTLLIWHRTPILSPPSCSAHHAGPSYTVSSDSEHFPTFEIHFSFVLTFWPDIEKCHSWTSPPTDCFPNPFVGTKQSYGTPLDPVYSFCTSPFTGIELRRLRTFPKVEIFRKWNRVDHSKCCHFT